MRIDARRGGLRATRLLTAAAMMVACVLGGCSSQPKPIPTTPPPTAREFAIRHNARVAPISRFSANAELRIRGTDDRGEAVNESVDGNLMLELPLNLSLLVKKLGEVYFVLGSNQEQYWWINLSDDRRGALLGSHAKASRDRVKRFGLPVQPVDLIDLLAITEIDLEEAGAATTRWISTSEVEFELPAPDGSRLVRFSPVTFEPTAIVLRDDADRPIITSTLTEFQPTAIQGQLAEGPHFQKRTEIVFTEYDAAGNATPKFTISMALYSVENRPINQANFDFERLMSRFRVGSVRSVDDEGMR